MAHLGDMHEPFPFRRLFDSMTVSTALGCGVVAGVFFAFSTFVMPALASLPPAHGVAAMQSINVSAINRWLMGALFGTAALASALAIASASRWSEPVSTLRLLAAVVYLVGVIGITAAFNVPRNDALAGVAADSAQAATFWPTYLAEWVLWNHVRMAAALAAATLLMVSLLGARTMVPS